MNKIKKSSKISKDLKKENKELRKEILKLSLIVIDLRNINYILSEELSDSNADLY